jgi:hypothetical protein
MAAETVIKMMDRVASPGEGRRTLDEIVDVIHRRLSETDATDPEVFQVHMQIIMALAGNQTAFAEEHGYQPGTVSRWVNGSKAPPPKRRFPVLRDAFAHLQAALVARPSLAADVVQAAGASPRRRGRPSRQGLQ